MRELTYEDAVKATLGGCILGGGGGGSRKAALVLAEKAFQYGSVTLLQLEELNVEDLVLTVSAVGAPSAASALVTGEDYVNTIILYERYFGIQPKALMTNECGGNASINGWLQAAKLGIPIVDAACNGRAHPTGVMGSMGLHRQNGYISQQIAVGGNKELGKYLESAVQGSLTSVSALVREASVKAGGLVAVARNAVDVSFIKERGAIGVISQCIALGDIAIRFQGKKRIFLEIANFLGGQIIGEGIVQNLTLVCRGGFDVGEVQIQTQADTQIELTFWNEYMTAAENSRRLYTFPDLIMTFEKESGMPITTAELKKGMVVVVLGVPKGKLSLGEGMRCQELLKEVEEIIGKPMNFK